MSKISKVKVDWNEDLSFLTEIDGHKFFLDADDEFGGKNLGPRPKKLLLSALAGCTGMDVVSMLKKMRLNPFTYEMTVEGYPTKDYPVHYHKIILNLLFKGKDLDVDKIKKAVNYSRTKYCGVSHMLGKAAKIEYVLNINDEIHEL